MSRKPAVSYLRASRGRTHRSSLEVEVQRDLCAAFAREHGYRILAEYVEIEFSKGAETLDQRPRLRAALARARRERCPVLVSHLDRLARNVNFLTALVAGGNAFLVAGDDALAPFVLGPADRTVARFPRAPARRAGGGTPPLAPHEAAAVGRGIIAEQANRFARSVLPLVRAVQGEGATTLRAVADALNERGIRGPRGGRWTATSVRRVLTRAGHYPPR